MGLFSSFSKSSSPTTSDKVWMTTEGCLKGAVKEALTSNKSSVLPVMITFFDRSHDQLIGTLSSLSIPHLKIDAFSGSDVVHQKNTLLIMDGAKGLFTGFSLDSKIAFIFMGHYPLLSTDNRIAAQLFTQAPKATFTYCSSLEDPFFITFGSHLKPMMEKMGMAADECIEHAMVTKSIKRGMEKISSTIISETKASSAAEWFAKNVASEKLTKQ